MSDFWAYVMAYSMAAAVTGLLAIAIVFSDADWQDRRVAARYALTCWAWPVWMVYGIVGLFVRLWEEAK